MPAWQPTHATSASSYPLIVHADHLLSSPPRLQRRPSTARSSRSTAPSATPRRARLHGGRGGGRLHLPVQLKAPRRPEAEDPSPLSRSLALRPAVVAPKAAADGLGRGGQAAGRGGGAGPRVGEAGRRRAAAVGARGRWGRAGARRRPGPVLRVPARVRGHRHRRHRLHLRVHEPAAGVRDRQLRQRPVRAAPGVLRLHRHSNLRVSVVQGRADGEQGGRGAGPQRRLHVTELAAA